MNSERTPVIVATGQVTERNEIVTTVELAARASEAALNAASGLRGRIQRVSLVSIVFSPASKRPASELVERLGLAGVACETTSPGGNLPQWLVTRAAAEIAEGKLDATLIAGAEATRSMRAGDPNAHFMQGRQGLQATDSDGEADVAVGPSMDGVLTAAELGIRLYKPTTLYPLFENALAHKLGRTFDEQRASLGPLMSRFSEIASNHPFAWFKESLTADEISQVSDANRLVSEPYTKRMNAFPNVDQGAAVVVTSLAIARELGLEDRCTFVWSGANAVEPAPVSRPDLSDSPAMDAASKAALAAAGVGADDLSLIDLYSCFPVAVEAGAASLGIQLDDARDLSVTGGLPFFGGPGNNYSMHAIATLADRLPEDGGLGYVGANGGALSKHAIGIYGATPPPNGFAAADTTQAQAEIDAAAIPMATSAEGSADVVAATVVYARDGSVEEAPVIATLDDGRRIAAQADESIRESLAGTSLIGTRVRLSGTPLNYVPE